MRRHTGLGLAALAVSCVCLGMLMTPAVGQTATCPGFSTVTDPVAYNSTQGCLLAQGTLYNPLTPLVANKSVGSAANCADSCTQLGAAACNVYAYCSNPTGCCLLAGGCTTNLEAGGTCLLWLQANLTATNRSDILPVQIYNSSQAQLWDNTLGLASSAHAFDSGVCGINGTTNVTADAAATVGFCSVVGADVPQNNFACGSTNATQVANEPAGACDVTGSLRDIANACYNDTRCTGFVYQPEGCCGSTPGVSSAWLKGGTIAPNSTAVMPFSTLYLKNGTTRPASLFAPPPPPPFIVPVPEPPPPASTDGGAIAGGVVAGVVVAGILAAAAYALFVRRRRGHWPLIGKQAEPPESDAGRGPILIKNAFNSSASSRSGTTTSTDRSVDATALLKQMKSTSFKQGEQAWKVRPEEIMLEKDEEGRDVKLGEGGFGAVYKGTMNGVTPVAVKVLHGRQDSRTQNAFAKEISILEHAHHPAILQYVGAVMQNGHTFLITELMEGGNLWEALSVEDSQYQWYKRGQHVALSIAQALGYLHTRQPAILHLDLKSQNVLLSSTGNAKLADVGLARVLHGGDYTRAAEQGFTWAYCSPEVLTGEQCSIRADVWSFHVLLWELCTTEVPQRGNLREPRVPEECPAEVADLIWRCSSLDPRDRPHTRELVNTLSSLVRNNSAPRL